MPARKKGKAKARPKTTPKAKPAAGISQRPREGKMRLTVEERDQALKVMNFESCWAERYHASREKWFRNVDKFFTLAAAAMTILAASCGTEAIARILREILPNLPFPPAALLSGIAAMMLIVKQAMSPNVMTARHSSLREWFREIANEAKKMILVQKDEWREEFEYWVDSFSGAKQDEPPIMMLLSAMHHQAQMQEFGIPTEGLAHGKNIFIVRRLLKNVWSQEDYCTKHNLNPPNPYAKPITSRLPSKEDS